MKIQRPLLIVLFSLWGGLINAQTLFTDRSTEEGTKMQHLLPDDAANDLPYGTGAAWFDADGDGDLDLFITHRAGANRLYKNNRIGTGEESFTFFNSGDAADALNDGAGVSVADYDNDGDLDLYLANATEDVLLSNDGDGVFTDVTAEAFPEFTDFMPGRGTTATWGDLNNDGWLDLYVSNQIGLFGEPDIPVQDYLFISNGGYPVTFYDASSLLNGDIDNDGINDLEGYGFATAFTDYDNDGDLDIYVTNDCPFGPEDNKLFRNNGDLNFTEVSATVGPFNYGTEDPVVSAVIPDCHNAMGIAVGDPNRDGIFDYFYTNWNDENEAAVFLKNDGINFTNETRNTGLQDLNVPSHGLPRISWGAVFLDYDLDMFQDLAVATGVLNGENEMDNPAYLQPNLLYHHDGISNGLPQYSRVDDNVSGAADTGKGRTYVMGDYDNDGDPDLYLVNYGGTTAMYRNENNNGNNWLIVDLKGAGAPFSNTNGIGAKVTVSTPDGVSQYHEVRSGSNLGGGDDMGAYFGLKDNANCIVTIQWPSGIVQNITDLTVNQRTTIEEPALALLSPANEDAFESGQTMNIVWESSFDHSFSIQLLAEDTLLTTVVTGISGTNEFNWLIPDSLETSSKYAIRLISETDENVYKQSYGYITITTDQGVVTGIDNIASTKTFTLENVYPNPFDNKINLKISLRKRSPVVITILDASGKTIESLTREKIYNAGKHTIEFNFEGFPPGIYFYKLAYNGVDFTGKLLKKN